jgi:peptidoglycan/LPS O-acetylase OafA/YrhL
MPVRNAAIDGIRGLAALSVLVFHVWLYRERPPGRSDALLDQIGFALHLGLICFFVLSGFLLYRTFARAALGGPRTDVGTYAIRRVARIVPAYYAAIFGVLALYALVGPDNITPSAGELPLFLVFGQNYSMDTIMGLIPVAWTLCVEVVFYLVLPFIGLLALAVGRRPRAQAALLGLIIVLATLWNRLVLVQGWNDVVQKALPAFMGVFACGMLAALWIEARKRSGAPVLTVRTTTLAALAGAALVVGHAVWMETPHDLGGWRSPLRDLPAAAGFALVIAAVAAGRGPVLHGLAWKPLAGTGIVSYGLYLWHLPLILALRSAGVLPEPFIPRLAVVLAASFLAAWLSWRLVERPAIAWSHRRVARRAPAPAPRGSARARPQPAPAAADG